MVEFFEFSGDFHTILHVTGKGHEVIRRQSVQRHHNYSPFGTKGQKRFENGHVEMCYIFFLLQH